MPITFEFTILQPVNAVPFVIVCVFVLMDIIVGLCKAFATKTYSSTKMREGLWHKVAILTVVILAYILEMVTGLMDFSIFGLAVGATIPMVAPVAAYIVLMETGSVLESIVTINPELSGKGLFELFGKFGETIKPHEKEQEDGETES